MKIEEQIDYYDRIYKTLVSLRDDFGFKVTSQSLRELFPDLEFYNLYFLPRKVTIDKYTEIIVKNKSSLLYENDSLFKNSYRENYLNTIQSLESEIENFLIKNKERLKDKKDAKVNLYDYNPYEDLQEKIIELEYFNEVLNSKGEYNRDLEKTLKEKRKEIKYFKKIANSKPFRTLLFKDYLIPRKDYTVENFLNSLLKNINEIKKNFDKWQVYLDFPAIFQFYNRVKLNPKYKNEESNY